MKNTIWLFASLLALLTTGCKKEVETPQAPLEVPSSYVSANYTANTTTEYSVRMQLAQLKAYMKSAENVANLLTEDSLNTLYSSNGNPSLSAITTTEFRTIVTTNLFPELASSSGNAYDPANGATAEEGGVYGARLFNRRAKETLEEVEKGLFEAALLHHFINLKNGTITSSTVDQMIAIYGAHPNFPNTNTAANTPTPDAFIALYAARRDKNDGTGMYTKIRDQFIRLKAAVEAGSEYNAYRDFSLASIQDNIEKAIMATVIHYGHAAVTKLTSTTPTPATIAGGLHDLGEAVGFVHGFRSLPTSERKISNDQIDEILNLLLAPATTEGTMYRFVTEGATTLPNITAAQNILKNLYGFTSAEMEDFKQNWITLQGR
jgi:hypothetical protein